MREQIRESFGALNFGQKLGLLAMVLGLCGIALAIFALV